MHSTVLVWERALLAIGGSWVEWEREAAAVLESAPGVFPTASIPGRLGLTALPTSLWVASSLLRVALMGALLQARKGLPHLCDFLDHSLEYQGFAI